MNTYLNMIAYVRKRLLPLIIFSSCLSLAQEQGPSTLVEAVPPHGLVKGLMSVGDRCCVILARGRVVYSNEVFTIISQGQRITWRVLEVAKSKARFAREVFPSEAMSVAAFQTGESKRGALTNTFEALLMQMEKGASSYAGASTRLQKDEIRTSTRKKATDWCSQNELHVKAVLADIDMVEDNCARVWLRDLEVGPFSAIKQPKLKIFKPGKIAVSMTREKALEAKAGFAVILSGQPNFVCGNSNAYYNILAQQSVIMSMSFPDDATALGLLALDNIRCKIFDPKSETLR